VDRTVIMACLPWLGLLVALTGVLRLLVRLGGTRLDWARLRCLHADQHGSAQSLSFVLTLPLFIMCLLFIVQVSQVMIGAMVVHYAAYAAARSAVVWIPARCSSEHENCVSGGYTIVEGTVPGYSATDHSLNAGPTSGGVTYLMASGGAKYEKIQAAAALACLPICPSRSTGLTTAETGTLQSLQTAYRAIAPSAAGATNSRLANKLAWAAAATELQVTFYHSNQDPPLIMYDTVGNPYYPSVSTAVYEFQPNEMGWQDPITVKVTHHLCLLPGPGSLLARVVGSTATDQVAAKIQKLGTVYTYALEASATLGNEGLKSVIPYSHADP